MFHFFRFGPLSLYCCMFIYLFFVLWRASASANVTIDAPAGIKEFEKARHGRQYALFDQLSEFQMNRSTERKGFEDFQL